MNTDKENKLIVDKITEAFEYCEGFIDWHLSGFPDVKFNSYCKTLFDPDGTRVHEGDAFFIDDDNNFDFSFINTIDIIDYDGLDYVFMPDPTLIYSQNREIGITGTLQHINNNWYLHTTLFSRPIDVWDDDIEESFHGKRVKIETFADISLYV